LRLQIYINMRLISTILLVCTITALSHAARTIKFINRCGRDIWVSPLTNNQGPALPGGVVRLSNGRDYSYNIPDGGWGGRFWPKTGCNSNGQACEVGQSVPPCPPKGCQPPAETKVEFFFPPTGRSDNVWYDVSLVDGYSLAATITPNRQVGFRLTINSCLRFIQLMINNLNREELVSLQTALSPLTSVQQQRTLSMTCESVMPLAVL